MKILFVALHFSEYSYYLAKELSRNNKVLLVLSEQNFRAELEQRQLEECGDLRIELLPHKRSILRVISNIATLCSLAKEFSPDVIHYQEVANELQTAAFFLLRKYPSVLTVHDPKPHLGEDSKGYSSFFSRRRIYRNFLRNTASVLMTHGQFLTDELSALVKGSGKKVLVVPHGPLGLIHGRQKFNRNTTSYLFFGRMHKYKGLEYFIQAIRKLKSEGMNVTGIIAGRGEDLDRHLPSISTDESFIVKNYYLMPQDVSGIFDEASAVVLPYIEGTQSGVAAYALGRGRASIVTNVGSLPEMIDHNVSGIVIPPHDLESLVSAMRVFCLEPDKSKEMGLAALYLGKSRLSWAIAAEVCETAYSDLYNLG